MNRALDVVFLGLSLSSSWGNGHATTYRGVLRELARRGHRCTFLERDVSWYADNRDLPQPPFCRLLLYDGVEDLQRCGAAAVEAADVVVVGSYVPDGIAVAEWVLQRARGVVAFYDIDTPVTLRHLGQDRCPYLSTALVPRFDAYLSFTGGPLLQRLQQRYGARRAVAFYCAVDPELYHPEPVAPEWDLGYMGTYSADRQPSLALLMLEAAREWPQGRFVVAGPQYPAGLRWPANVHRIEHVAPTEHRRFYARQRFTLNLTREDMVAAGWSPSVRLFEAAACGTAIVGDWWPGLDELLRPGVEILVSRSPRDTLRWIRDLDDDRRRELGRRARDRILLEHTAAHRALQLERLVHELLPTASERRSVRPRVITSLSTAAGEGRVAHG